MKNKKILLVLIPVVFAILAIFFVRGGGNESADELLHFSFDEEGGATVADVSGKNEAAEVRYAYTKAAYKTPCDPEWRENGIKGGALLFDGASTYVSYKKKDVRLSGEELFLAPMKGIY